MRTHSLLRSCLMSIPLLHLAIILSLLYPPSGGNLWQVIFPSWVDLVLVPRILVFSALMFPPLASWVASRLPTRMVSLVGLWISLALSLAACLFFWRLLPPLYFSGSSSVTSVTASTNESLTFNVLLANLLSQIPFFGFGLSSILCFVLAIRLPLLPPHEQTVLRVSQRDALASSGEAGRERSPISAEETRPPRAGRDFRLLLFAFFGLLCHLLIAVSLFFPYIDYDPENWPITSTGWQLLAQAFQPHTAPRVSLMPPLPAPLALVLLTTLILPALIYLVCLLLWPVKSEWKDRGLRKSVSICYVLNLLGLSLSSFFAAFSVFSYGAGLHDVYQNTDVAFAIPSIAFLLSLACSSVLLGHFLPRTGWALRIRGIGEGETHREAASEEGRASKSLGLRSSRGGEAFQRETIFTRFSHDRKRLVVVLGALLGLITLIGTSWLVIDVDLSLAGVLGPSGGVSTSFGWGLSRGEEFPFGVSVENVSDEPIRLLPITFPLGFSASLQLRREVLTSVYPVDTPDQVTKVGTSPDVILLGPHMGVSMTLIFVATAQGAYTIGPVTAHADVPFLSTTVLVSKTYTRYALLCVEVDPGICRQSAQDIPS
jgi:hypothetical protein